MDRILRGRRNVRPLGAVAECEDLHLDNVDELAKHFRLGHCLPDLKRHHRVTAGDRILGLLVYEAKGISPSTARVNKVNKTIQLLCRIADERKANGVLCCLQILGVALNGRKQQSEHKR